MNEEGITLELGELLFLVEQKIIGLTDAEFSAYGLPATLRPLVIECVKAHYVTAAYDHMIAVKATAQVGQAEDQKPKSQPKTRSGEGIDKLKESLDADFGRADHG